MSQPKNQAIPGVGFVFTDDGLSLAEMAARLHEHGYITDAEMAGDGGVAALRRKLYDQQYQNRHHYSSKRPPWAELTEEQKAQQLEDERLTREINEYAAARGVNSPEFMSMIIQASDFRKFGLDVTAQNIVAAELIATAMQKNPESIVQNLGNPSELKLRLIEMVEWVLDGRPEQS